MASYPTSDMNSFSNSMQQNPAFSYPTAPENEYMAYQMPTTNTMQTPSFPTTQVQSPTTPSTVYMMPQGNGTHAESATVTQKTANFNAVSSSNLKFDKTPQTIICPNCGEKVVTRVLFKNCTGCNWLIFICFGCIPCCVFCENGCNCGSIAYHSCSNCSYKIGMGGAPC